MTLRYTVTPVPYSGTFHVELVLSACDELLLRLPALDGTQVSQDSLYNLKLL